MNLGSFGIFSSTSSGGGSGGTVDSIVAGRNITVDSTDPANPIVSTTADDIIVVANYSALPDPTTVSNNPFYWCSASQGTAWLWGSLGGTYYPSGMYYSNGVSWEYLNVPYQATQATVNTGTNNDQFVTPSTLTNATVVTNKKVIATGNAYKFETTDSSGNLQETTVTASMAVATDANGLPVASATTAAELGYVSGVTSAIQTQLDAKKTTTLQFGWAALNPADSTKYYPSNISTNIAAGNTATLNRQIKLKNAVSSFDLYLVVTASGGSNESVTVTLENITQSTSVNFTTSLDMSLITSDTYSVTLSCNAGDYIAIKFVTPIFATNPTRVALGCNLSF